MIVRQLDGCSSLTVHFDVVVNACVPLTLLVNALDCSLVIIFLSGEMMEELWSVPNQ